MQLLNLNTLNTHMYAFPVHFLLIAIVFTFHYDLKHRSEALPAQANDEFTLQEVQSHKNSQDKLRVH